MALQLPREADEQLRMGLRIVEQAYDEKTRALDHELQQLRAYSKQQQSNVAALERRVAELEQQVRDGDERTRQLSDEKAQLSQDLKATQRDLSKLDAFKRSILQSINDEDIPSSRPPLGTYSGVAELPSSSLTSAPPLASYPASPAPASLLGGGAALTNPLGGMSGTAAPSGSAGGSYLSGSSPSAAASAAIPSAAASATTPGAAGGATTAGAAAETPNVAAVMDGKDFFRQARLRLTYEQFNQFLTNIKRLNDHAQTRDETLAKAQEIFGADNSDLFDSFKSLLSKHGLS